MNFGAAPFSGSVANTITLFPVGSSYRAADNNQNIFSRFDGAEAAGVKLGSFLEYLGPEAIVLLGSDWFRVLLPCASLWRFFSAKFSFVLGFSLCLCFRLPISRLTTYTKSRCRVAGRIDG
ncbi:hypothetical protein ES703_28676 [subsurface metagenome]